MKGRAISAALVALAWTFTAACAQRDEPSLPRFVLPDLSALAESVQRQLHERDRTLTQTIDSANASVTERAAAYGDLGRLLAAAKLSNEAESCYRHAQALMPDDMRWPYYLGHVYLIKGQRADAAASFERALELRPSDPVTLVWLAETYLDDGRPDAAESTFVKALSLQPPFAAALFGAGRAALARQAYAEAVQYLEKALSADAQASAVHYPLAMAYRALGDQAKAESHLRQLGNAWPDLPDPLMQQNEAILDSAVVYEGRGIQALKAADWAAATAAFRKGLEFQPDDASLRYWLGAALYADGDAAGAEREFTAVIRRSPEFAKAHFSLGVILESRGQHKAAIEQFSTAVKNDPTQPEVRLRLAETLRATGQLYASVPQYEQAVTLDPGLAEAWLGGARAFVQLQRYERAREWLTQARQVHPDRVDLAELLTHLPANRR